MAWTEPPVADPFVAEGVTLFTIEMHPTKQGYSFTEVKHMVAWRDRLTRRDFQESASSQILRQMSMGGSVVGRG